MDKKSLKIFHILFACLLFVTDSNTYAATSDWVREGDISVRLVTAVNDIGDNYDFEAALEIKLDNGWHTYWKNAGDSGLPPRFDWSKSENIKVVDVSWPAPKRFKEGEFTTFGYADHVTFPLKVNLQAPETETSLHLKADILVCKDICIPKQFEITLSLPGGRGSQSNERRMIAKAYDKVPHLGDTSHLKIETVVAGPDALVIKTYSRDGYDNVDLFVTNDNIALSAPLEIEISKDDDREALIRVPALPGMANLAKALKGEKINITMVSGDEAIETYKQF